MHRKKTNRRTVNIGVGLVIWLLTAGNLDAIFATNDSSRDSFMVICCYCAGRARRLKQLPRLGASLCTEPFCCAIVCITIIANNGD